MANRLLKSGRTTYVAAVPSRLAVPAYCVSTEPTAQVQQQTAGPRLSDSSRSAYSTAGQLTTQNIAGVQQGVNAGYYGVPVRQTGEINPLTGQPEVEIIPGLLLPAPSNTTTVAQAQPSFTEHYVGGQVCYPAVPGVQGSPAQVIAEPILGWNGGARSIDSFVGDGFVQFRIPPRPVALVAGFTNNDASPAFNEATHGVYAHGGTIAIVERGQVVATATPVPSSNPLVTIARRSGRVTYYVAGWTYRSTALSEGTVYLDAALYSTGDYVDSPDIGAIGELSAAMLTEVGTGAMTLPPLTAVGSEGGYAEGASELPSLLLSGTGAQSDLNNGAMSLPSAEVVGSVGAYAIGVTEIAPLTTSGDSGFPQFTTALGSTVLPAAVVSGLMRTGTIGSAAMSLPAVFAIGSEGEYASGGMVVPAPIMYGDDGPEPGTYGNMEFTYLIDFLVTDPIFFGFVSETLELTDSATFVLIVNDSYFDTLVLDNTYALSALIGAVISERLVVNSNSAAARTAALQYAVNLTSGALTTYQGFDFLGFARTKTETLGWKADGVYRIGGNTDDGALRNALVDFGTDALDTNYKKHIPAAFLGLGTDGCAYLRMSADDGCEKVYRVIQRKDVSRANPHKGVSAREWHVKLEVVDATDAVLDNIEYAIEVTTRRWTR